METTSSPQPQKHENGVRECGRMDASEVKSMGKKRDHIWYFIIDTSPYGNELFYLAISMLHLEEIM